MINRVVLVGRLTRDPELRRTGNGAAVCSFTIAVDRNGYQTQDGQTADFIPCVVWNKPAENTAQYCNKGTLVGVEGRIRTRNYTNNQGQKVYVTEVQCDSVQFLETRAMRERNQTQNNYSNNNYNQNSNQQYTQYTPRQPQQNNTYDSQQVELQNDFDNSVNTFDIMEDDIQF